MNPPSITAYTGTSVRMHVALKNPIGTPYDLTGGTFLGQLRTAVADAAPVQSWAVTVDGVATAGAFFIFLSATQTAALSADSYVFDIRITPPSGEAFIVLGESRLTMRQAVTR